MGSDVATALVDRAHRSALVDDRIYAVAQRHDDAGEVDVFATPGAYYLGRVTRDSIAPTIGVQLTGRARRRRWMRALGAIQRAWWADDTQRAAARGEDGEGR